MPPRRPPQDVSLDEFLSGLLAGLALKDVREVTLLGLAPALAQTAAAAQKVQERLRLRLRFRIPEDALDRPRTRLWQALERQADEGAIEIGPDRLRILMDRVTAALVFDRLATPLDYHARCARAFLRAHATARVRCSLDRLRQELVERRSGSGPPQR